MWRCVASSLPDHPFGSSIRNDAGTTREPGGRIALGHGVTRTVPHMPVQVSPLSVEWYVHRNRNVPVLRNRLLTADPTGSARRNDQFPPNAMTSCNWLTPRHLTTVSRATVTVDGDQLDPTPRTTTGLACAVATSVTTSTDTHADAPTTLIQREPIGLDKA